MVLQRIEYCGLSARQRENYNYQKLSALLADYGFSTIRLSDDWQTADFIAQHVGGEVFLKVQLKGRMWLAKKYIGKQLHIAFRYPQYPKPGTWYLYPHDEVLDCLREKEKSYFATDAWAKDGLFHFPKLGHEMLDFMRQYQL